MNHQLPYGLKNNQLVSIEDVEQGVACGCVCPSCGGQLIARKGAIRVHHFAHYQEVSCQHALETTLHLAAKAIIKEQKEFYIPSLEFWDVANGSTVQLFSERKLNFEKVELEVKMKAIQADIVAHIGKKQLIIELAVTHFIDKKKYQKIKALDISAIEVDLRALRKGFTKAELYEAVIKSIDNKKWIYNRQEDQLIHSYLQKKAKQKLQQQQEQERRIQRQQERALHYKRQKRIAINNGWNILQLHEYGGVCCPKIVREKATYFNNNSVISVLRKGARWNGMFYGQGANGKYVFLNGEKTIIFPKDSNLERSELEHENQKRIYGQLHAIRRAAMVDLDKCESCPYFDQYVNDSYSKFICKYQPLNTSHR